jgi:hypothetical protein
MFKQITLLFLILGSANQLLEAQKNIPGYRFHSVNSLVLVNGSNAVSASLQSVNGFKRGSWFAGIGTGLDYYLYRSIPFFADLRYEQGKKKNKLFAYADAGINFSWVKNKFNPNPVILLRNTGDDQRYKNGFYTDAGLGITIGMKNENALVFSLGHSHKSVEDINWYTDWRSSEKLSTRNTYHLNRILFKAGWQF